MEIIRIFDISEPPVSRTNILKRGAFWTPADRKQPGEILLPVVHPRLANRFFGFQAIHVGKVLVAVTNPTTNLWFAFDGVGWQASSSPVFSTPRSIREGMPLWAGAIQFLVRLEPDTLLQEVKVGYEVRKDLLEYLLETALPLKLTIPMKFSQNVTVKPDGYSTGFPEGFDGHALTDVQLQLFDQPPVEGSPVPESGRIELAKTLIAESVGQLLFTVSPTVEFSQSLYQISQVPCVIVREIGEGQHHKPIREDSIQISETEYALIGMVYGADQEIEISCIATKEGDARKMAIALSNSIEQDGKIYLPPHDLTLSLQLISRLQKGTQTYIKSGTLPTVSFRLLVRNISY
jgi:hypothetical protein